MNYIHSNMTRRDVLKVLGASIVLMRPALAQDQKIVGVLAVGVPDPSAFLTAFRDGLREQGYNDGGNIRIVVLSANGDASRLPALAAELVRHNVDVIVGFQTPTVTAAKQATSQIPIVMDAGDPVGMKLVASLARPGGNVTGMSAVTAELAPKNLEFLTEIVPSLKRLALFINATDPFRIPFLAESKKGAEKLGIELQPVPINGMAELKPAFDAIEGQVQGVMIQPSLPVETAAELALAHHLPAVSPTRGFIQAGGLLSYCANYSEVWKEMSVYVVKILKGAKPADLPVEQPTKFELSVNLKSAQSLGLEVSRMLVARADEIIE